MLSIAEDLRLAYPGAAFGVLVMTGVSNPPFHAGLEERKRRIEEELRGRFAGMTRAELNSVEPLGAYAAYYGRFKQNYHVLLQLESIVHKGRSIPSVAALVESMFLAELRNMLLTAGHDLAELSFPLRLGLAKGRNAIPGSTAAKNAPCAATCCWPTAAGRGDPLPPRREPGPGPRGDRGHGTGPGGRES